MRIFINAMACLVLILSGALNVSAADCEGETWTYPYVISGDEDNFDFEGEVRLEVCPGNSTSDFNRADVRFTDIMVSIINGHDPSSQTLYELQDEILYRLNRLTYGKPFISAKLTGPQADKMRILADKMIVREEQEKVKKTGRQFVASVDYVKGCMGVYYEKLKYYPSSFKQAKKCRRISYLSLNVSDWKVDGNYYHIKFSRDDYPNLWAIIDSASMTQWSDEASKFVESR